MTSRAVNAGGATIELSVLDRVDKGLKSASRKMKKWGSGLMKAGAALTGSMAAIMAGPVKLASDLQENMAKFNTVFGDNAKTMESWAVTTSKAMGTSKTEMVGMLGSMQDLLVPMGVMGPEATAMTQELSKLAVDLGSFNNMRTGDTFRDMMAAMTGSSEVLAKYGVVVNESLKKQEALRLGLIRSEKDALTPAMKAQATYSLIMQGTTAAQGDAERTSGSFANQLKRLRANAVDLGAQVGTALLEPLSKVMAVINRVASSISEWMTKNPGLAKGIAMAAGAVGALGAALLTLGGFITAAGVALGALVPLFGAILSPLGLIIGGIVAAGAAVAKFTNFFGSALDYLSDLFGPLVETVQDSFSAIMEAMSLGDLEKVWDLAAKALEFIWLDLTNNIREYWYALLNWLGEVTVPVIEGIGKMFQKLADFLRKIMDKYKNYYNAVYNWVVEKAGEATGVRTIGGPVDAFGGSALDEFSAGAANFLEGVGRGMESGARPAHEARMADRANRLRALRERRNDLRQTLQQAGTEARNRARIEGPGDVDPIVSALAGAGGMMSATTSGRGSTGTFSAAAAAIGGGPRSPMQRLAKSSEKQERQLEKIADNTKDNIAKVGK